MSIFMCSKCGCMENTAVCGYNYRGNKPALCSECDPAFGKWHDIFPKKSAKGHLLGSDGFVYPSKEGLEWRIKHQGLRFKKIK